MGAMINLKVRSEYSFRQVFGKVINLPQHAGGDAMAITDRNGTWGHVAFSNACKMAGIKPIFGVELFVVDTLERVKQDGNWMTFLAIDKIGLCALYDLVKKASDNFYYLPRLDYGMVRDASQRNLIVLSGNQPNIDALYDISNLYIEMSPNAIGWNRQAGRLADEIGCSVVATSNAYYPRPEDVGAYEIVVDRPERMTGAMHICTESELRREIPEAPEEAFTNTQLIADKCNVELVSAPMLRFREEFDLRSLCEKGLKRLGIKKTKEYKDRLERELGLIAEKDYADYFMIVSDMIHYAKKTMMVGPSRGSSAGSLVCYLLGITEADPIVHGLIFERFIDITRMDLPDIDIDFPDVKREGVIQYLIDKYGEDCVAHIGTVSKFRPKSAIGDVAKKLGIPVWETKELKDSIIERSGGDARAAMCLMDTFSGDVGKEFLKKHPSMAIASELEDHARHSGVHAAGIIVCNTPVVGYCGIDSKQGIAQIDKKEAEQLNLLKIDCLGLRTLSVLEDACDQIGMSYEDIYRLPLDDKKAFDMFNKQRMAGIFQFEGYALQSICRQMPIEYFDDIVAITALARPGPLHSGGTMEFIARRTGKEKVTHLHDAMIPYTSETYGTVVYQEQVMQIVKNVGSLSWEDTSTLRKAMSKSLGEEFFNKFWLKFWAGCKEKGIDEQTADLMWKSVMTFGSWAFNKSHAVSYGLISYWCAWFKAHYPLEFSVACLRNPKDDKQCISLLRELTEQGFEYETFNFDLSEVDWSVKDGKVIGGFLNVHGVGEKTAQNIVDRRDNDLPQTAGVQKKLDEGRTPYDDIFECERLFGDWYKNPKDHKISSGKLVKIDTLDGDGEYIFLGKIVDRSLRDLNEYGKVVKRGGTYVKRNNLFLNITVEDDTDSIICTVSRFNYQKMGKAIAEGDSMGKWFLIKGGVKNGRRKIYISRIKQIS